MAAGRQGHTATLLSDGRVLIVGGSSKGSVIGSAELFQP
jgi:Galactose oxidase, central domain